MHILLVSATPFEIAATTEMIASGDSLLHGLVIETLVTGVGMVAATHATTKRILRKRPALAIQAGIGGSTSPDQVGKVYAITEERMADLGVTENRNFRTVFDLQLAAHDGFPFSGGALKNPYRELLTLTSLDQATGLSVNEITTDAEKIRFYHKHFSPAVESMEGAAFHYVCLLEKIPFLQVRAVSNLMGERDKKNWRMGDAIANLHSALTGIFEKLNGEYEIEPGF